MGREIKRVPLSFDWPFDKVWEGYLNPHYVGCSACQGSGSTWEYNTLEKIVQLFIVAAEDSLDRPKDWVAPKCDHNLPIKIGNRVYPHPYLVDRGIKDPGKFHVLVDKLIGMDPEEGPSMFRYAGTQTYLLEKKILEIAGLDWDEFSVCKSCKGEGIALDHQIAFNNWEKTEPPKGDGWQLWETVSEGSPVSPVFETQEEFLQYLVNSGYSELAAINFIDAGWCPSGMTVNGKMFKNIDAMSII